MSVDPVSDVFAFVCQHADFSNSILFSETDVPEIEADERDAIAKVGSHIEKSYVTLLKKCRENMFERADAAWQATMQQNWNRDRSIWDRGRAELPLFPKYVAVAYFWIGEEPSRPGHLSLVGELCTQVRRQSALAKLSAVPPVFVAPSGNLRVVQAIAEGVRYAELATAIVDPLWPLAVQLRSILQTEVEVG